MRARKRILINSVSGFLRMVYYTCGPGGPLGPRVCTKRDTFIKRKCSCYVFLRNKTSMTCDTVIEKNTYILNIARFTFLSLEDQPGKMLIK